MAEPKYKFGDLVEIEGTSVKGVITRVTRSDDPEWPHKYKIQSEHNALTFDEGSIVLIK